MTAQGVFAAARRAMAAAHERNTSLCDPFLSALPVTGASVSVLAVSMGQITMCASNSVAARLDELQFDLGEGPCWQAFATHRPVLTTDLTRGTYPSWPIFAEAVRSDRVGRDVGGMFAFPLVVASLDLGAVDLYVSGPGTLDESQVADAAELARLAGWQVLRRILDDHRLEGDDADGTPQNFRREIHQATGMVLAQLDISPEDAALLIRAHAFSSGRSVRELAADIVARRLDFSPSGEPRAAVQNDPDESPPGGFNHGG